MVMGEETKKDYILMTHTELRAEATRLREELKEEKKESAKLRNRLASAEKQERNMAILHRSADVTDERRIAHARSIQEE